jgi:hypothetical protein
MVDKKANHEELRESNQRESAHDYQKSPDPTSQVSRARPGAPIHLRVVRYGPPATVEILVHIVGDHVACRVVSIVQFQSQGLEAGYGAPVES